VCRGLTTSAPGKSTTVTVAHTTNSAADRLMPPTSSRTRTGTVRDRHQCDLRSAGLTSGLHTRRQLQDASGSLAADGSPTGSNIVKVTLNGAARAWSSEFRRLPAPIRLFRWVPPLANGLTGNLTVEVARGRRAGGRRGGERTSGHLGRVPTRQILRSNSNLTAAASQEAGAPAVTMSWTPSDTSHEWSQVAVPIKPAKSESPLTGTGVTVAVVDSGLLQDGGDTSRIKTTRDFTAGSTNPSDVPPVDAYGHGTHIAGLIGGDQAEVKGVAPGVSFVSLRALNGIGAGYASHVIAAVQWAVANKAAYDINLLNLSLGHPIFEPAATDPLVQAVEAAWRAGIVVVVSAGNIGRLQALVFVSASKRK
jgi:hypothetical protein